MKPAYLLCHAFSIESSSIVSPPFLRARNIRATKRLMPKQMIAAAFLLLWLGQAHSLDIVFVDIGATPMSAAQLDAFTQAAAIWEGAMSDPITVNVNIAWAPPASFSGPTILGSTKGARTTKPYSSVLMAMMLDSDSADETAALSQLPGSLPILDINGLRTATMITMSTANAKALGMSPALDPNWGAALQNNADAQIRFNTSFLSVFDLDPSDGIGVGLTDFVGTAAHEIGHALGFWSMTDNQDLPANASFQLGPNVLDIWRFAETGMAHALNTDTRQMTAGAAEYDDSELSEFMSRGSTLVDPNCNSFSGQCQASHWRDDAGNMLDPTIAPATPVILKSDDVHAMDYAGYEQNPFRVSILRFLNDFRTIIFDINDIANPPLPLPGGFPPPPPPPAGGGNENMAMIMHVDFGSSNDGESLLGGARTLLGIAEFHAAEAIQVAVVNPVPTEDDDWEHIEPPRDAMPALAPMICNPIFVSDEENGVEFTAAPLPGDECLPFDGSLGDHGGWRLPLCVDNPSDNGQQAIDCDSRLVLELLLESAVNEVILAELLDMGLGIDPATPDNVMVVQDASAMQLNDTDQDSFPDASDNCTEVPNVQQCDGDNDGYGNWCDSDFNNDDVTNGLDVGPFVDAFGTADPTADLNCDGVVNGLDVGPLVDMFGQAPGPSGLVP